MKHHASIGVNKTPLQQVIDRLHILGYIERIVWSQTIRIPQEGMIIRPDPGDVLRYTQQERTIYQPS